MLSCPFLGENSRSALEGEVPGVNNAVLREVAAGSFSIFPPNSFFSVYGPLTQSAYSYKIVF